MQATDQNYKEVEKKDTTKYKTKNNRGGVVYTTGLFLGN